MLSYNKAPLESRVPPSKIHVNTINGMVYTSSFDPIVLDFYLIWQNPGNDLYMSVS